MKWFFSCSGGRPWAVLAELAALAALWVAAALAVGCDDASLGGERGTDTGATADTSNLDTFGLDSTPDPADVEDAVDAPSDPDTADVFALDVADAADTADTLDTQDTSDPDAADTLDTQDATDPDAADSPDTLEPPPYAPARYPADTLRSPINGYTADRLQDIYDARPTGPRDDVLMKVGASGTVSTRLVFCFAPTSSYGYDLDGRSHLQDTIDHFNQAILSGGTTSFDRVTLAAEVGRSASWVISGTPSPLEQEIDAISPRFALVNYGTNDMGLGATYESALWPFVVNMTALLDQLEAEGIIPIITGLNPRGDSASAERWAKTYNAVTRALAEQRQVPFIDLLGASDPLANHGLLSDGIHGNSYTVDGSAQPCVFTAQGLAFNYNQRNLLTLATLDAVREVVLEGAPPPDPTADTWQGDGSPQNPFVIDRLPFSHSANTQTSPHRLINSYPACDSGQNEGGAELYYRLSLQAPTAVRWMVFDDATADLDLHLLGASGNPATCTARNDRIIQGSLGAGEHVLVVDSFVSSNGTERPGAFLLVVVPCEVGDPSCQ